MHIEKPSTRLTLMSPKSQQATLATSNPCRRAAPRIPGEPTDMIQIMVIHGEIAG